MHCVPDVFLQYLVTTEIYLLPCELREWARAEITTGVGKGRDAQEEDRHADMLGTLFELTQRYNLESFGHPR